MSTPVRADDVGKSFGDERVLDGIDLAVEEGELLVLMGPNGVGKSVLLSCLAGGDRPSEGSAELFGVPATENTGKASFLLQDALCLGRLSGRANLSFYSRLHPEFTDRWREYVETLGIDGDLERKVGEYSGGMKRKLELAIALGIDAPVYLLDEPTASLDLAVIQDVHGLLRERQAVGSTVVVTSHLPIDADIADRIAFLTKGGIVATGTPEELLAGLPAVVSTTDANAGALTEHVIDGRLFENNGRVCGFLPRGTETSNIGVGDGANSMEATNGSRITKSEPTYTDLFNYYTKLPSTATDRSA